MSYSFNNRSSVREDVRKAYSYYKQISSTLAKQFMARLREAKADIKRTPFGFQVKYENVRTLMLQQFPYQIHYLIDEPKKQIIILAIVHTAQEPDDYRLRK